MAESPPDTHDVNTTSVGEASDEVRVSWPEPRFLERFPGPVAEEVRDGMTQGTPGVEAPPGFRVVGEEGGGRMVVQDTVDGPCPWVCQDPHGLPLWLADWGALPPEVASSADGTRLRGAWFLLPDQTWLALRPGVGDDPLWGASHRLDHLAPGGGTDTPARTVGRFPALPLPRVPWIPPFDRPARLPPGAGEILLNFLARLLVLGVSSGGEPPRVRYRGPYPTPMLFRSLLRSFTPDVPEAGGASEADLLATFTRDEWPLALEGRMADNPVAWRPAPWQAAQVHPRLRLHRRGDAIDAWLDGHPFRFTRSAVPQLPAGARVWPEPGRPGQTSGGIALLGRPWRTLFRIDATGPSPRAEWLAPPTPDSDEPPREMHPQWAPVLCAWAAAGAHPVLAPGLLILERKLAFAWSTFPYGVATLSGDTLMIQPGLGAQFRILAGEETPQALAMRLVSDVLESAAALLRNLAQRELAEADAGLGNAGEAFRVQMARGTPAQETARARLQEALPTLVAALMEGNALPQ